MKELALCIDKEFGKAEVKSKKPKSDFDRIWNIESVTERLLANLQKKNIRQSI